MKKRAAVAAAILIGAIILMGGIREVIWHQYKVPETVGSVLTSDSTDQESVSREWFRLYTEKLMGFSVPYDYRIVNAQITRTELLTGAPDEYVQIDYKIRVASDNNQIRGNLELISTDIPRVYHGQMVLRFSRPGEHIWKLEEKMRPVEYQIRTPGFQQEMQEPQTEHFNMKTDEPMTYYIKDETLYVTYDSGETFVEVPDGYETICGDGNGRYNELLLENSYIITREFTGFLSSGAGGAALLYSTDMGQTWEESRIGEMGNHANTFLSKTQSGYYVTFSVDRSLGTDYYLTFFSEDLASWDEIALPRDIMTNLDCAFWSDNDYGYYPAGDGTFYLAKGRGAAYQEVPYPEPQEIVERLGFNPFDTMERMYQKDGITYMVVGQGDDADYAKDGKIMKALYQSVDGENFTFVEEMNDEPEQAG